MSKVRIGIVGTSWWTDLMHVPAIESHAQAELVASCGRNTERTREFAGRHGIAAWFTDYEEMIANAGLDGIVIVVPEKAQHDICLAAAEAGLHVVCEKPLAIHVAEVEAMVSEEATRPRRSGRPWLARDRSGELAGGAHPGRGWQRDELRGESWTRRTAGHAIERLCAA